MPAWRSRSSAGRNVALQAGRKGPGLTSRCGGLTDQPHQMCRGARELGRVCDLGWADVPRSHPRPSQLHPSSWCGSTPHHRSRRSSEHPRFLPCRADGRAQVKAIVCHATCRAVVGSVIRSTFCSIPRHLSGPTIGSCSTSLTRARRRAERRLAVNGARGRSISNQQQ
jgi:hypothetical protein